MFTLSALSQHLSPLTLADSLFRATLGKFIVRESNSDLSQSPHNSAQLVLLPGCGPTIVRTEVKKVSKYRCSCGFDEGTEAALDEHLWELYKERRDKKRQGEPVTQLPEHIASWLND